jgi:hypothetical protein
MLCQAVPLVPCNHRQILLRSLCRCILGLFRACFFEFSLLIGLFSNFPGLMFRELPILSPKTLSIATMVFTLLVLEFSIAISLALIVSSASLVALIGWVLVESK